MRAKLFTALIALLAILVLSAPPPAIATDTMKADGETPFLTAAIASRDGTVLTIAWITVSRARDDTESDMVTWTSSERGDVTITATAIPILTAVPTATLRGLLAMDGASILTPRLAGCQGTGTAHDGTDTRKPTALIASTGGHIGQPLRR